MYLASLRIENFRKFGSGHKAFEIAFRPGLTALVGENDSGKSAIIDALRFALGTTDLEWYRLEDSDFHLEDLSKEIRITCTFENLTAENRRVFLEYLTYDRSDPDGPFLYVNWTARNTNRVIRGKPYRLVETRSGKAGDGPVLSQDVKELLRATYLRPLRDAESALAANRGSRLSQILQNTKSVRETGQPYLSEKMPVDPSNLNVLGIGDFANSLLESQKGVVEAREAINKRLFTLTLRTEALSSQILVSGAQKADETRLRSLLEKFELTLEGDGKSGLGSNNLLFIASELLLLSQENAGNRFLLIEEPEAHLHPQRQLRVMKFVQEYAVENEIQVLVTTHSPNLASAINLENLILVESGRAFPMRSGLTRLDRGDYRFLERFLDVTKANLFFANAVLIVEGDAENILLPTIARLIGCDLTTNGVSIVNVGGTGLHRYARIFQRNEDTSEQGNPRSIDIRVGCITDLDIIPDSATELIKNSNRRTHGELGLDGIEEERKRIRSKAEGQLVKTFVANQWTFEYDLAFYGLARELFVAVQLAKTNENMDLDKVYAAKEDASKKYEVLLERVSEPPSLKVDDCEALATAVYRELVSGSKPSKAIAAQYMAEILSEHYGSDDSGASVLIKKLPPYVLDALQYVTPDPPRYTEVGPR
jgi:putative ATP-dependent endonuclease of the OLD family